MKHRFYLILVLFAIFSLTACSSKKSSSSAPGGGGGGGGDSFCFEPKLVNANPGDTVNFTLLNGTPPYQLGYVTIQSYNDPSDAQGSFNSNTGVGSYVVGPNGDCTDILAAQDATGTGCSMTIYVGGGGGTGSITAGFTATPRSGEAPHAGQVTENTTST